MAVFKACCIYNTYSLDDSMRNQCLAHMPFWTKLRKPWRAWAGHHPALSYKRLIFQVSNSCPMCFNNDSYVMEWGKGSMYTRTISRMLWMGQLQISQTTTAVWLCVRFSEQYSRETQTTWCAAFDINTALLTDTHANCWINEVQSKIWWFSFINTALCCCCCCCKKQKNQLMFT